MRIDKERMKEDMKETKEFCMLTIEACKKLLATSDNVNVKQGIAILAGLSEIKRVVKDYFGNI